MSTLRVRAFLAIAAFIAVSPVNAERSIENFDEHTWDSLQRSVARPAAVVFTATYCESCPQVFQKLNTELEKKHIEAALIAVVINGAEDPTSLNAEHYATAQRLFVFDGDEASLRYRVDPSWRGVTPFVALLPKHGAPVLVTGMPSSQELARWLR